MAVHMAHELSLGTQKQPGSPSGEVCDEDCHFQSLQRCEKQLNRQTEHQGEPDRKPGRKKIRTKLQNQGGFTIH